MSKYLRSLVRRLCPVIILTGLLTCARAEPIAIAGTTTGTFNGGGSHVLRGLRFTGNAVSSLPSPGEVQSFTFGRFQLTPGVFHLFPGGDTFTLQLSFTTPGSTTPQTASVMGNISRGTGLLGVYRPRIIFGGPVGVSFAGGTFNLQLNDVVYKGFGTLNLSGTISGGVLAAATPEPHSVLLLGTAIGIVGLLCRKRRHNG